MPDPPLVRPLDVSIYLTTDRLALQRLAAGDLVTTIAGDLGYDSVSAFITMFKRMLGKTPARYFEAQEFGAGETLRMPPFSPDDTVLNQTAKPKNVIQLKRS